jgi:hypothetical protein
MTGKVFIITDGLDYRMKRPNRYAAERFIQYFKQDFSPILTVPELEQIIETLERNAKWVANHHENCELWLALADELKDIIQLRKAGTT